jgi:phospholipase C
MTTSEMFIPVPVSEQGFLGQSILHLPWGLGFRLPFYIISPWTRGGHVFVENADHISQIKFVGKGIIVRLECYRKC